MMLRPTLVNIESGRLRVIVSCVCRTGRRVSRDATRLDQMPAPTVRAGTCLPLPCVES